MAYFAYNGRNAEGAMVQGVLEAPDSGAVATQLFGNGITPVEINETTRPAEGGKGLTDDRNRGLKGRGQLGALGGADLDLSHRINLRQSAGAKDRLTWRCAGHRFPSFAETGREASESGETWRRSGSSRSTERIRVTRAESAPTSRRCVAPLPLGEGSAKRG